MAKSMRSKWKRKMRAIKRERYGKKELEKLKMIVQNAENIATVVSSPSNDEDMKPAEDSSLPKEEPMDLNDNRVGNASNKFPIWVGSHKRKKILSMKRKRNKIKKKEIKKTLKKRK